MDLGGQESRTGVQAELKIDFSYRALVKMGYAAVGFGPGDLRIDLFPIVINFDEATKPLVSANVALGNFDSNSNELYKVVEVGGMRIGITSVLGKKEIAGRKEAGDFALLEPYQAIPRILGELREKKCDHLVLLANAEPDETKDLARRFPEFDWVMTAHGAEEPPKDPGTIEGTNTHIVEVGQKAEYLVVVGLYKNGTCHSATSACRWIIGLPMRRKCSRCRSSTRTSSSSFRTAARRRSESSRSAYDGPQVCWQQDVRGLPYEGE